MRSSVGQCRNIRFRQLSASHVIITSDVDEVQPSKSLCYRIGGGPVVLRKLSGPGRPPYIWIKVG